ncbi:MAG TPA: PAS domain S-box protein [Caulobacteraceae bacterium]|nr:PAS domain S-box protein [Caulobacteraceae bacterium]
MSSSGADDHRYETLVNAITDLGLSEFDGSGRVAIWNVGAERLSGYSAAEAIGLPFSTFFTVEDRRQGLPGHILDEVRRHGRHECEGWRLRKDGARFYSIEVIDAVRDRTGRLVGFANVCRDITERRLAQEALRESDRQFRLLVSGVVDYAIYMLDPEGLVSSWNAGARRIKGYEAEEVMGRHFSMFYSEPDRAAGAPDRNLAVAREQGRSETEGWRRRKDGSLFWASVVVDAIRDESGRLIGFAKITRDITERRQAQLDLQAAQEQLAQAQKMEALGQLTGGVAHDFNNLMMIVAGQSQALRAALSDHPRALRSLDAIDLAVNRGGALTRQLLTFSRRQRLNTEPVDLVQRLQDFRAMLASSLRSGIRLETDLPEDLWPVAVDLGELELALVNIAVNARDAMPDGGAFRVTAENLTLGPGEGAPPLAGDFVRLSLSDTGVGIPPDILAKVFEPFFTTKPVGRGTGLGLSQVHGLAHQSGGAVEVTSELGKGTSIRILLPRATHAPAAADAKDEAEPDAGQPGARVLVVEDNPEVAAVTATLLQQLGYRTDVVGDADSALAAVECEPPFDLVFSDIVMAGSMDGLALARRLRETHPELPVLLTSGYSRDSAGADDFEILRKPFQISELGRLMARSLARRSSASDTAAGGQACAP